MSESDNSHSNNLCIPEDAFEQFQAVSMYQEEKYITLPEIVSEKPRELDPGELSFVSYDNEVVITTENEVNSTVEDVESAENQSLDNSGLEPHTMQINDTNLDEAPNALVQDSISPKVIKRARKQKHNIDNDTTISSNNSDSKRSSIDIQDSNEQDYLVISSSVVPRKRGRKPKPKPPICEKLVTPSVVDHDDSNLSKTLFSSDPESSDTVNIAVKRKRGRPRKISVPNHTIKGVVSDKELSSDLSGSDSNRIDGLSSPNKIETPRKGKRGRPRKISNIDNQQNLDNHQNVDKQLKDLINIDDLNKTQPPSDHEDKKEKVDLDISKIELLEPDNKHESNSDGKLDTNKILNNNFSDYDESDDIILSSLKILPEKNNLAEENSAGEIKTDDGSTKNSFESNINTLPEVSKKGRGRQKKGCTNKPMKLQEGTSEEPESTVESSTANNDIQPDIDDTENLSLSELKALKTEELSTQDLNATQTQEVSTTGVTDVEIASSIDDVKITLSKRHTKMPVMSDFEYNVDSVVENEIVMNESNASTSLLVEDTSKRSTRRRAPKLHYDEESDEDPFANVELSEDDEPRRRKGNKYYSDDEYVPGRRGNKDIESTDSEANVLIDEIVKHKRKKLHKKSEHQSPRKKGKAGEPSKDIESDDVEICLEPSVIKASDDSQSQPPQYWGNSNEFENFLAKKIQGTNLKIKKLSATDAVENKTLEIPVIDPEARKTVEMCTQTSTVSTVAKSVQTTTPYDIPMKENITLTPEQSEKACHFLKSIVKTTSELGTLMTQKSEDFIKKKINTTHVTDTTKMDYCVKKSFLLFKLAKHNLIQMEEDLAKQYDEFLSSNNLSACREKQKHLEPSAKQASSDSDCEIVEEPVIATSVKKSQGKPKFNPKTVFLNKELSIKIAKKPTQTKTPTDNKKLDIKGRHTVWINDTVMVKKVKSTQSFLAQDSRNKKPPDYITTKMVSDFFKNYYRQNALSVCAPFITTDWLEVGTECVCNYFVVKPSHSDVNYSGNVGINTTTNRSSSQTTHATKLITNKNNKKYPETLLKLCFRIVKNQMHDSSHIKEVCEHIQTEITEGKYEPVTLSRLCLRAVTDRHDIMRRSLSPTTTIASKNQIHDADHIKDIQSAITDGIYEPVTLFRLCLRALTNRDDIMGRSLSPTTTITSDDVLQIVLPLKTLCHQRIVTLLSVSKTDENAGEDCESNLGRCSSEYVASPSKNRNEFKSLLTLCVEFIQQKQVLETSNTSILSPKALKSLTYEFVKKMLHGNFNESVVETSDLSLNLNNGVDGVMINGLTINSINTLSEEAFLNLEQSHADVLDNSEYLDDFDNEEHYEPQYNDNVNDEENPTETSWVSQLQMRELRSCFSTTYADENQVENLSTVTQIKLEPLDDMTETVASPTHVKSEPAPGLDEMTIIPNVKPEVVEHLDIGPIHRSDSISCDVERFEEFVATNKIMHGLNSEDIFSQSALRIHRQHEPDYEEEDMSMSLLVPQMYEPRSIETAKGSLMKSSSDEEGSKNKKIMGKKRPDRRNKGKQKKPDPKITNKEVPILTTDKPTNNEVATLTKRMRDRIRQDEKKDDSTDSETENIPLRLRSRKEQDKVKLSQASKTKENEIQCNNVDSTDQVEDDLDNFTGFTAIDQNEISTYQKYMKYVYDKIIPEKEISQKNVGSIENNDKRGGPEVPLIAHDEPVELLECQPTMPIFDDLVVSKKPSRKGKGKVEILKQDDGSKTDATLKKEVPKNEDALKKVVFSKEEHIEKESPSFIDRHGWQCYPVKTDDSKLYLSVCVALEKLPESFVQTYFEYQGISSKDENDDEIDRLTNLSSLKRTIQVQNLSKTKALCKRDGKGDRTSEVGSRPDSPTYSDHYAELEPSDDEGAKVEDEVAPPLPQKHSENILAKSLLMNDHDSDSDTPLLKVKQEPLDNPNVQKKCKPGSKSKKKEEVAVEDSADLMLTADKMMNKELTLLHAPVVVTEGVKEMPSKGPVTRNKQKAGSKHQSPTSKTKAEEDSSSEEEKQWVTTKEKLLKRMSRKDTASMDDAKRAKLVSEFIERRGGFADFPSHMRNRPKSRRSGKKFLERQKQLRVLSRELFGESSDPSLSKRSQKAQASLYKGRRNIRKVIDKKSLARSTVVANMEEFERKRRLNARQTKLRELLGCEEGVNVLVINDEVCLEYDFEENRPVVTIHPFFTKVMKAHQYEGVKFMWDACFESLADIAAGHPGGGCILAHCMGLGKTLQVLALLHTVLTHPGVKMQRVLVCCPLSTVLNWVDEIHKWIGPVTNQIKVFELSKLKKIYERAYQLEDWYNGGGIFIIGYELFRNLSTLDPFLDDVRPTIINKIRTALLDPGPDIIICDEGHLLKNDCSVLAVAMSRVVTKRRIILTGTPMQNNLREYYCMVNFVKPNLLGTYSEYSNRFENPIMNGQHRDSREEDIKLMKARTHILHKVLEGCLQRQEASVLYPYLPKKHEYTVFITLTPCQWDLYKHYLYNYGRQSKQNILKDFHILQKIWSHPQVLHYFQTKARDRDERNKMKVEKLEDDLATEDVEDIKPNAAEDLWWLQYLDGGNMLETLDSSNKFVVVFRILDECVALGDKVLIFSTSLFCLDALEYFLKKINKWSLGQEYFRLDGSVPAEVRQKWCREFNADHNTKTKLFLVSTRAGCLGLNMTAANRVIIMDTSWNPAHDIQSIFRVYRFGQKKDCYIYRLVAMGTMEQKIYERSVTKQAVACRVVDEQQIDRHYNMAELTELYKFDEGVSCVAGGVAAGVRDVVLLRVARDAALHAVHEHDSLLRGSSEQGLPEHERNAAWMQFQQEQAHKQMENHLIVNIPNIPNVSLKRIHGHDYALSPTKTTETEIKSEDTSENYNTNGPKAKKGKKQTVVKCLIPIHENSKPKEMKTRGRTKKDAAVDRYVDNAQAGTSKEKVDSRVPTVKCNQEPSVIMNQEEVMVDKITDILLKYNFQNRKGNAEIAELVTKVKNMVKKGFVTEEDMSDDLTASIASILLPQQVSLPKVTDIMCESINNSVLPNTNSKDADPEVITSDPTPSTSVFTHQAKKTTEPEFRTKRKAAIAAEKCIDSLAHDIIINLDDDDWDAGDTDFIPDTQTALNSSSTKTKRKSKNSTPSNDLNGDENVEAFSSLHASVSANKIEVEVHNRETTGSSLSIDKDEKIDTPKSKPGPKSAKDRMKKQSPQDKHLNTTQIVENQVNETVDTKLPQSKPVEKQYSSSILLSDEGDMKLQPSSSQVIPHITLSEKPPKTVIEKPSEDEEIVPLPMSLLKNEHFINIVSHTYLAGNPMLDEDAANLAAQYSTLKALKEAERTGKDVCSGPIYDIAVKVIGKEGLKIMRKTTAPSADAADPTAQTKEKTTSSRNAAQEPANKLKDDMIKEKFGLLNAAAPEMQTTVSYTSTAVSTATEVVPVGLIKTAAGMSASKTFGQHQSEEHVEPRVECILPDDDDVIISDVRSTPVQHASSLKNSQPVILNHTLNKPPPIKGYQAPFRVTVGNVATTSTVQTGSPSKIVLKASMIKPKWAISSVSAVQSSTSVTAHRPNVMERILPDPDTICLDSDDDETITPTKKQSESSATARPKQEPVPVSLTMANAPGVKLPLPSIPTPAVNNINQPLQPHTLVLRQVTTPNGTQPKYVLVSSDKLPTPTLPKALVAEMPKTVQSQNGNFEVSPSDSVLAAKEIKKAEYKRGDILRISKTGVIELINSNENTAKACVSVDGAVTPHTTPITPKPPKQYRPIAPKPPPHTRPIAPKPSTSTSVDLTKLNIDLPKSQSTAKKSLTPISVDLTNVEAAKPKIAGKTLTTSTSFDLTTITIPDFDNRFDKGKNQKTYDVRKNRQISSSSSSSSSRAPSPDNNPLSILKDVIQISAADYPTTSTDSSKNSFPGANKSIVLRTEKNDQSNISVQHVVANDSKKISKNASNSSSSILKLTPVPKNKVPKLVDSAAEKQRKKDALITRIEPSLPGNQPKTKESTTRGKNTINFDNFSSTTSKLLKSAVAGKTPTKKPNKGLKVIHTDSKPGSSKTVDLTNLNVSNDAKKRISSSTDQTPTKKKKSALMTLQDFNLDDMEDIIELE